MTTIIELKNVWKIYKMGSVNVNALQGVSLKIKKGEFVSILGPSGSGKSTLMNLVGSLDWPSKGDVYLDNHNISHLSESKLAQIRGKKIGYIFQQFNLIPTLTALQNVMLPMIFQNIPEDKRVDVAKKLLERVGLGDRMDHKPKELSGGQMQRVAVARALANNPEVILADEPTGNLDTKTGLEIMKLLGEINKKEGKTVILVTHDQDLVQNSKRVIYIKDGRIEKISPREKRGKK
jgi:putative ABC transport system ATP-binding protein